MEEEGDVDPTAIVPDVLNYTINTQADTHVQI